MTMVKVKILTIYSFSQYKNIRGRCIPTPYISLQGKWLKKLGFKIGSKVTIKAPKGILLVKLLKNKRMF